MAAGAVLAHGSFMNIVLFMAGVAIAGGVAELAAGRMTGGAGGCCMGSRQLEIGECMIEGFLV